MWVLWEHRVGLGVILMVGQEVREVFPENVTQRGNSQSYSLSSFRSLLCVSKALLTICIKNDSHSKLCPPDLFSLLCILHSIYQRTYKPVSKRAPKISASCYPCPLSYLIRVTCMCA